MYCQVPYLIPLFPCYSIHQPVFGNPTFALTLAHWHLPRLEYLFPHVLIPLFSVGICSDVILPDILPFLPILSCHPAHSPYFALFFFKAFDSTWNYTNTYSLGFCVFFFWLCCESWRILVLPPRTESAVEAWKHAVLTTGPPGKSPNTDF